MDGIPKLQLGESRDGVASVPILCTLKLYNTIVHVTFATAGVSFAFLDVATLKRSYDTIHLDTVWNIQYSSSDIIGLRALVVPISPGKSCNVHPRFFASRHKIFPSSIHLPLKVKKDRLK